MVRSHIADRLWLLANKEVVGEKPLSAFYDSYPRWEKLRPNNTGFLKWMADNCYTKTKNAALSLQYMRRYDNISTETEGSKLYREIKTITFAIEHSLCRDIEEYLDLKKRLNKLILIWCENRFDNSTGNKPISVFYAMMLLEVPVADRYLTAHYRRCVLPKPKYDLKSKVVNSKRRIGFVWLAVKSDPSYRCLQSFIIALSKVEDIIIYFDDKVIDKDVDSTLSTHLKVKAVGSLKDEEVAELIHQDDITILINNFWDRLRGMTLFALRPAPVALNFMGVPGRYFSPHLIDYNFTDKYSQDLYKECPHVEKNIILPSYYQLAFPQHVSQSGKNTHKSTADTFGLFARPHKITPVEVDICMRLLSISEDVKIVFICKDSGLGELTDSLLRLGLLPRYADRVSTDYEGATDKYYRLLQSIDVFIDTSSHWGALTTGLEVLAANRPLLSIQGQTLFSNHAKSLLSSVGMAEVLLCASTGDLVYKATKFVLEPGYFKQIIGELEQKVSDSKLFDMSTRCDHFHTAFEQIDELLKTQQDLQDVIVEERI